MRCDGQKQLLQRRRAGFTLVETLVSLLIVLALTGVVAAGIPVAFKAYRQVVNGSNAEVALSTTTSALRDELGLATGAFDGMPYYRGTDGLWRKIVNASEASPDTNGKFHRGLVVITYVATADFDPASLPAVKSEDPLIPDASIANAVMTNELIVSMEDISYDETNDIFVVSDLRVTGGDLAEASGEISASLATFKVRSVLGDFG